MNQYERGKQAYYFGAQLIMRIKELFHSKELLSYDEKEWQRGWDKSFDLNERISGEK